MKSRVTRILSIGIALVAVSAVQAQDKTVTANVPFTFYMGASAMPQGAYRVDELSHGAAVRMTSTDAAKALTTHRIVGKELIEPARLVFHRIGDSYFLAQIWAGGASTGQELDTSRREKELSHNLAAPTLSVISIALHQ